MDLEKYQSAAKQVKAKKPPENYIVVNLSYDTKLILPHKAGLAFMAAIENAEVFKDSYSDKCRIIPLERDSINNSFMSDTEYQQIKIANLMDVSLSDIQKIHSSA
jgi:hypothetical protein